MDFWVPLISTRLESPQFEFIQPFIGGNCVIQKDYIDQEPNSNRAGWLIHVYFRPVEFLDRPFVADLCFRCGTTRREILAVLVKNDTFFGHIRTRERTGRLIVAARIRKMLCEVDLLVPSSSRQFCIQNFDDRLKKDVVFYVNMSKMGQIGGDLFKKWKTVDDVEISTTTENLEQQMLELLMESTAKYDDLLVLRHSVDRLVLVAQKFRMHKLMRAIEDFLSETKLMNWDEKILLALQYRMSMLYVQVQRKYLLTPWNILCRIQRLYITNYARNESPDCTNPYSKIHNNLMKMVMMTEENVCIG